MAELSEKRLQRIREAIDAHCTFQFCGPYDPDEITAVTIGYRHIVIQLKRLASPILAGPVVARLNSLDVEIHDLYSAFDAHSEIESILPDIEDAIESPTTTLQSPSHAGDTTYFSDREIGEAPLTVSEIPYTVWRGVAGFIVDRIEDGSFGTSFPEYCPDGRGPYGTDETRFWEAVRSEIPNLAKVNDPLENQPALVDLMDLIEFCWQRVGKPEPYQFHEFFGHDHLNFDDDLGRSEFRDAVNLIFRRNGLVYELTEDGEIERIAPAGFREPLLRTQFHTGEAELDRMLETARRKFMHPAESVRREALEKLWDAWERLKTIEPGKDKASQVTALLDRAGGPPGSKFRDMLESEAQELTRVGNTFQIRHSETSQESLRASDHVDYLFQRLFSLIRLLLHATGRGG